MTSKYSWVIRAFSNPQFALDFICQSQEWHEWGTRCWNRRPLQGSTCSQPLAAQIAALVVPFLSWKIGWAAGNLPTSDLLRWFQQNPDRYIYFIFLLLNWRCWKWFTSDRMDLAEWFNSSHAAGCRKILTHFTERMFLLSFLVITYLHELAQLGGSGGSCVAPSVCIFYHWFGGQIIKPRIF